MKIAIFEGGTCIDLTAVSCVDAPAAIDSADKAMPEDALAERERTRLGVGAPMQGMVGKDPDAEEARAAEEGEAHKMSQINETGHVHDQNGRDIRQTHEDLVDVQNGHGYGDSNGGAIPSQSRRSSVSRVSIPEQLKGTHSRSCELSSLYEGTCCGIIPGQSQRSSLSKVHACHGHERSDSAQRSNPAVSLCPVGRSQSDRASELLLD